MKKFISIILSLTLVLSCAPVFAMPIAGEIVETTTIESFTDEIAELTEEFPAEKLNDTDEYSTSRLFAKADADFYTYGANKVIIGVDGLYILQYSSPEQAKEAEEKIEKANSDIEIEPEQIYYSPDSVETLGFTPNPSYDNSTKWQRFGLDVLKSHVSTKSNPQDIKVAVIDTGVRATNQYFVSGNRIASGGYSYVGSSTDITDGNGHGTNVSGIITQLTNGNVKILPIKVFDSAGVATQSAFWICLQYAISQNAKVVNLSLGSPVSIFNDIDSSFISRITGQDVLVCAASGNDSHDSSGFMSPGNIETVLTVGSCNDAINPQVSKFSNIGSGVDIYAPGEYVYSASASSDAGYSYGSGTSQASPIAAATAANILTLNPNLANTQVKWIIANQYADGGLFDNTYKIPAIDGKKIRDWVIVPNHINASYATRFETHTVQMQGVAKEFVSSDLSKDGNTKTNAYVISTKQQLVNLSNDVKKGHRYTGKHFKLNADIDMSGIAFVPIGTWANPFQGSFYGEGHVISKLSINKPSEDNIGLFGVVEGASIERLAVLPGVISGRYAVGAIVGTVIASDIKEVYTDRYQNPSNSSITGSKYVGGIAGVVIQAGVKKSSSIINHHGIYNVYSKNIDITGNSSGGLVGGYFAVAFPSNKEMSGANFLYNSYAKNNMKTMGSYGEIIGAFSNQAIPYYAIATSSTFVAGTTLAPYTDNYSTTPLFRQETNLATIPLTKLRDTYKFDTNTIWDITTGKNENMPHLRNVAPTNATTVITPTPSPTVTPTSTPSAIPYVNSNQLHLTNTYRTYGATTQPQVYADAGIGAVTFIGYRLKGYQYFALHSSFDYNVSVGEYELLVEVASNANYLGGQIILGQTFKINKKSIIADFSPLSKYYDGSTALGNANRYWDFNTGVGTEKISAYLNGGTWGSKNVGTNIPVTFANGDVVWSNNMATGGSVQNYTLTAMGSGEIKYRNLASELYVIAYDIVYNGNPYNNAFIGPNINETPTVNYIGRNGTTYNSATPPKNIGDYTITASYIATTNHSSAISSDTFSIKPPTSAPPAPEPQSKTTTSITLVPLEGGEYSRDGGKTWRNVNVFAGLNPSTTYNFVQRYKATSGSSASLKSASRNIRTSRAGWNPFKDIYGKKSTWDSGAPWYYTAVQFMHDNKLTSGTSATTYSPNGSLSRRAYVTFLWRLDGAKKNTYKTPFKDVSNTAKDDMSNAIRWAYKKGIASGMTKTKFAPKGAVSRQAMSAFTYRYQKMKNKIPKDITAKVNEYKNVTDKNKINPSLATAVQKCFYQGQLRLNGTKINPTAKATRADVAYAMYYFLTGIGWAK